MTDRFVTVPDSLELPAAVKVPVARLVGTTGAAATPADLGAATAEQGEKADASDVAALTLMAPLALTVPAGFPAGQVYRVTLTQDGTGGHPVTYGPDTLAIDTDPGASTLVEIWPSGAVVYPGAVGSGGGSGGYPVQQVAVTGAHALDTSAWPESEVVTVVFAQNATGGYAITHGTDVVMASGVTWAPSDDSLAETVAVFRYSVALDKWVCEGLWVSYAPAGVDTTPPTVTSLTVTGSGTSGSTRTLTVNGAADPEGLPASPYRFSLNAGATLSAWQSAAVWTSGALDAGTYAPRAEVRNTSGLTASVSASDFTVAASGDTTPPTWAPTLTPVTIADTTAAFTASALATDNVDVVTGYQVDVTGTGAWAAITPAGSVFTLTGLTASTAYTSAKLRAYDAAGNYSAAVSVPSFTTAAAAWLPTALTPVLWLDADDTSTITAPDGVTSWASKGSGSWAAVQDMLVNRPQTGQSTINGRNVVTFDTNDATHVPDFSGLNGANQMTFWFVGTAMPGGDRIVAELSDNINNNNNCFMVLRTTGNAMQFSVKMNGAFPVTTTGVTFTTTPQLFVGTWDMNDPTFEVRTYVNGTANSTSTASQNSTSGSFGTYHLNIGARSLSALFLAGGIADLGITATVATLTERQKLEGYLAHKWGLTASLPAEHPYKSVAP